MVTVLSAGIKVSSLTGRLDARVADPEVSSRPDTGRFLIAGFKWERCVNGRIGSDSRSADDYNHVRMESR